MLRTTFRVRVRVGLKISIRVRVRWEARGCTQVMQQLISFLQLPK